MPWRSPLLRMTLAGLLLSPSPTAGPMAQHPDTAAQESAPPTEQAVPATPAAPGLPAAAIKRALDAYVQPYLDAGHLSGNLLVQRGGETVYERSFGMANYELSVPCTPETRFNIASITKPMTVIVLIQLAVAGKLAMSDPLSRWIPDFPRGDEITVEHLARHQVGMPHSLHPHGDRLIPQRAASYLFSADGIDWNGVTNGYRAFADWHKDGDVTVVMGEDGRPERLDWKLEQGDFPCPRIGDL